MGRLTSAARRNDMATTTLNRTTSNELEAQAITMQAIIQNRYGSPHVFGLRLEDTLHL
jgi:hypothetical protein